MNFRSVYLLQVWVAGSGSCLRMMRLWFLSSVATVGCSAGLAADANLGAQLARQWCAPCHVIAANQQTPTGEASPFAEIARRPNFNADRLAFFLLDPHPKMPDMSLTRAEAANLAAYIGSLAR